MVNTIAKTAKTISWKVIVDGEKIAIMELSDPKQFPKESMESHLIIIGLLENIKDKHLAQMKTLVHKSATKDVNGSIKIENDLEEDTDNEDDGEGDEQDL